MRHVDETLLHALLDDQLEVLQQAGALPPGVDRRWVEDHVARCDECRARLREEERIRDDAALVLRDAALTTVDVPPFEMVTHDVPAAPPQRRRTAIPLAWAATVVLALGAGWWGSMLRTSEQPAATLEPSAAPPAVAEATAPQPTADAVREAGNTPATAAAAASTSTTTPGVAPAVQTVPDVAELARAETASLAGASAVRDAPASNAAAADAASAEIRAAPLALQDIVVTGVAPAASPAPLTRRANNDLTRSRIASDWSPAQRVRNESADVPRPPREFRDAIEAARSDRLVWVALDSASAGIPVNIAGMTPISSDLAHLSGAATLSRVIHDLDDGVRLEMLIWRDTVAPSDSIAAGFAQAKAETSTSQSIVLSSNETAGGRELLVYLPAARLFVLLSGNIQPHRLLALSERLVLNR